MAARSTHRTKRRLPSPAPVRRAPAGHPHVAVFWLASEDHDFAEIDHTAFPAGKELAQFTYDHAPGAALPAGNIILDDSIVPLVERAAESLGPSDAANTLVGAYRPGRTFAQAFAEFYSKIFAAQGLLVFDANNRDIHRLGAPVLRAGIERADELHAALIERGRALEAAGYHAAGDGGRAIEPALLDR